MKPSRWLLLFSTAGYSSPGQCALSRPLEADGDTDEVPSSSLEPFRTKNSSRMSKRQKTRCLLMTGWLRDSRTTFQLILHLLVPRISWITLGKMPMRLCRACSAAAFFCFSVLAGLGTAGNTPPGQMDSCSNWRYWTQRWVQVRFTTCTSSHL